MATTLLFVHGTGVRTASMIETFNSIKKGLKDAGRPDIMVDFVDWGEELGTKVTGPDIDDILPLGDSKAIDGGPDDEALSAALWAELMKDPLFELRVAAMRAAPASSTGISAALPGQDSTPDVEIIDRLVRFQQRVPEEMPGGLSAAMLRSAVATLLLEKPVIEQAAISAGDAADSDLINALARAIVAQALDDARGQIGSGPDALFLKDERAGVVAEVAKQLAPDFKNLGGWLFGKIKAFVTAGATNYGKKRRDDLMHGISPGVGDILLYQRHSDEILTYIEDKILELAQKSKEADPQADKIVVLGHSLGGIMLVDLLTRPRPAGPLPVAKLITVASQSPMFLKCDALQTIRRLAAGPSVKPFIPWLNFFDRNDFLSFCATRAFPYPGIEDKEVKSGVPFPDSHGAYFRMKEVYAKIVKDWP